MLPNHNASTSKTPINQARDISHPYLQAQAQPTTSSPRKSILVHQFFSTSSSLEISHKPSQSSQE
ncbi:hypothetical protein CROQUDRAFT_651968 [Cronartium quercuum f. sp. fusiforme G11]|uniref:Uncharacterized protein n=1 Tax=Cronartium quercuum f. sp. fusiforme G11 TaxID=708437 RepID=A0A9P6NR82_9BASI|nr:hypothetical protein CROQUDRAFT_651968 [Cronartium quercuum f. sp. fusiforme G11]